VIGGFNRRTLASPRSAKREKHAHGIALRHVGAAAKASMELPLGLPTTDDQLARKQSRSHMLRETPPGFQPEIHYFVCSLTVGDQRR
jgi:hypothetical protein